MGESDAVMTFAVNVKFSRDFGFSEGEIELHAVFGRDQGVFVSVEEESRRSLRVDLFVVGKVVDEFLARRFSDEVSLRALVG